MAVDRIDRADVVDLLKPIWAKVPVTATRLLPRLDLIFDYAISEGLRSGNNPADRVSVRKSLPKASKVHTPTPHKALKYSDVPGFMAELRRRQAANPMNVSARALEFVILTAMRRKEVVEARWEEFDLDAATWTIPAKRMKIKRGSKGAREAHRVPLSPAALALLASLPREDGNPYLFIALSEEKKGEHIDLEAPRKYLVDDMGYRGRATPHGFRSSFRTWGAVETDYSHEVLELAIAHYPHDKTVSAYLRTDLLEKRKPLMDDWAAFVESKA
jgi:integrase